MSRTRLHKTLELRTDSAEFMQVRGLSCTRLTPRRAKMWGGQKT